jgi:uncharacterized protein
MNKTLCLTLSLSLAICGAITIPPAPQVSAIQIEQVPNPRKLDGSWVSDGASLLDAGARERLNTLITRLEKKTGTEIAVVTVSSTAPYASPKEFANALYDYWGLGKKGQDNGILS